MGKETHCYLHRFGLDGMNTIRWGKFKFSLSEPLELTGSERLLIKQCVLPGISVKFQQSQLILNGKQKVLLPEVYLSHPFDLCRIIINLLNRAQTQFSIGVPKLSYKRFGKSDGVEITLLEGQSLEVTKEVGNFLFGGKTYFSAKSGATELQHWFKIKRNYENNVYYLTCDLLKSNKVGNLQLPLLNTLVVQNTDGGPTQTSLLWSNDTTQGEAYLNMGVKKEVTLCIFDKEGHLVQLKGGVFFIHFKVCT